MQHHAYLILGSKEMGLRRARELFSIADVSNDPDVHFLSYEVLGIDDARLLQRWAYQKPVNAPKRYFVITCDGVTHETQNALLKLFEEPPETSAFALIVSHEEQVLPTLRSRFSVVHAARIEVDTVPAAGFLSLSYAQRIEEIAQRLKEKESGWVSLLLNNLEAYLYASHDIHGLRAVLFVRKYIDRRGASVKMLLENLALSIPPQ